MMDILDRLRLKIQRIPAGSYHTCGDACTNTDCLLVGAKQKIEELEARLAAIEEVMLRWNSDANYTDQNAIYAIDALTLEATALAASQPDGGNRQNCGLCGQPRADHAEVAPDGKPECRMKENSHHE